MSYSDLCVFVALCQVTAEFLIVVKIQQHFALHVLMARSRELNRQTDATDAMSVWVGHWIYFVFGRLNYL